MDTSGRRSRNAGVGLPEDCRRPSDELPVRIGRRRRGARPLFDHRTGAGSDLPHPRCAGRDQPDRLPGEGRVRALPAAAARGAARADCRMPDRSAGHSAAAGRRAVRLSRLRHGAADGASAQRQPGSARDTRRAPDPSDHRRRVRFGEGPDHHRHAGASGARHVGEGCAGAGDRAADGDRRQARCAACRHRCARNIPAASPRMQARTPAPPNIRRMVAQAKEYIAAGDIFQVVLSQRFETPFALSPFSLYRALRRVNPAPFLYFLDLDGLRDCGIEPGNPGAGARRPRHHPPDRRHAAARRDAARRRGARTRTARRSEGARRASDAARSRPQRCRTGREDRHRRRHRQILHRALQPGHAYRLECRGRTRATIATRSTR